MKRGFGDRRLVMMLAATGLMNTGLERLTSTYTAPRPEPDNRGRRAEKDAERVRKAEAKRARKAEKRLKENT